MNEKITVNIDRACKPGEVNRNGYVYDIDAYHKALKEYNEKLNSGIKSNLVLYNNIGPGPCEPNLFIGELVEIFDNYIKFAPGPDFVDLFKNHSDEFEFCMNGIYNTEDVTTDENGIKTIHSFKIQSFALCEKPKLISKVLRENTMNKLPMINMAKTGENIKRLRK